KRLEDLRRGAPGIVAAVVDHLSYELPGPQYTSADIRRFGVPMQTAKLFWSGRSQAVRLPKDFRFDGKEVHIHRRGNAVILEPIADDWAWLDNLPGKFDQDFIDAVNEQPPQQERPDLDDPFC